MAHNVKALKIMVMMKNSMGTKYKRNFYRKKMDERKKMK